VLLSRRYLDDVGLFDERYFLYYEDFDLAWRGRARGWRYLYVPGPPVRHVHSASTVENSRLHHHYSERNRLLTLTRNAPGPMAARAAVHHALVTASYARRDVFRPLTRGQAPSWETVRRRSAAFASFLARAPSALGARRRLRRRQRVPDREVLAWAAPPRSRGASPR
jgi:GT2 family glycosyltransferase